jgi:hypothetical protein
MCSHRMGFIQNVRSWNRGNFVCSLWKSNFFLRTHLIPSFIFIVASFLVHLLLSKIFTYISTHHVLLSYATKINHLNSTCWDNFTKRVSIIRFITSYFSTQWGMYIDNSLYISIFIVVDNFLFSSCIAIPKFRKVMEMSSRTIVIMFHEKK